MAFTVTLVDSRKVAEGDRGVIKMEFDCVNTGGSTGGVVAPSSLVTGARKLLDYVATGYSAIGAVQAVKSYDSGTYDADILTVTTAADLDFKMFLTCQDAGA